MGADMAAAGDHAIGRTLPQQLQDLIGAQRVADQHDSRPGQLRRQLRQHGPQILGPAGMVLLDTEGP